MLRPCTLPLDWLSKRASSPEVLLRRYGHDGLLDELIEAMKPGDEIRKFNSPKSSWQRLAGRFGYALVHKGTSIEMVVLRLN